MSDVSISRLELEALNDVLEAARCFWHPSPNDREKSEEALRVVNKLYWRLGSELTLTGQASERYQPVHHTSNGGIGERLLQFILDDLVVSYSTQNDPWFGDTVIVSSDIFNGTQESEVSELRLNLSKMGLSLEISNDIKSGSVAIERRDTGPFA